VAWNGSREAARAVHEAMPLLKSAAAVDVVVVVDGVTSDLVVEVVDEAALGAAFTRVAVVRGSDVGEPASVVVTRTSSWGAIR
jgi:hypothetical protein